MNRLHYSVLVLSVLLQVFPAAAAPMTADCLIARGRLLVPVQLNGSVPCLMLLDLAARHPVLDPRVIEALKLSPTGALVKGTDSIEREIEAEAVSVELAPAPGLRHVDAAVSHPMDGISRWLGTEIGGVLPAHLPGFEVTLEFERGRVIWRELSEATLEAPAHDTVQMSIAEGGAPVVQGLINQQHLYPLQLDLDCGTSLALSPALLDSLRIPDELPRLSVQDSAHEVVRLERLKVGEAQLEAPLCALAGRDAPARLGLPFLRQFRITLNYEFGLCRLDPAAGNLLSEPPVWGLGLSLQRIEQGYWRVRVLDASPAARAGVQTGDVLVAARGASAAGLSHADAEQLLSAEEGAAVVLDLTRNATPFTVELISERLL